MSKNIFQIWYEIGKSLPFGVRRENWSSSYYTIVEKIEMRRYPYGKAYGYPTIDGVYSDHYEYDKDWIENKLIPCAGCYQWAFVPNAKLPTVDQNTSSPSKQKLKKPKQFSRTTVLNFGKFKGRTMGSIFVEDPNYIFWCISNIPSFFIPTQKLIELAEENNLEIPKSIIDSIEGKKKFFLE